MKLIIGLGNPGTNYEQTRHNAGFLFINILRENYEFPNFIFDKKFNAEISEGIINSEKIILAKPQTFMNRSGESVQKLIQFYKIESDTIIVASDDLDILIGNYKISEDTRAAGHNGIQNIIDALGTQNFTRIRIGVEKSGGRNERGSITGEKFVLQKFDIKETTIIKDVIKQIIQNI